MPPSTTITTTARSLRLKARTIEAAIRHLGICIEIEVAATLAFNQFQTRYTLAMRNTDPLLRAEENRLIAAKTKAWNDRFAAWRAANPPTIEDVLWIVAKSGFTNEVAPLMNLSKATRESKNLQRFMREVKMGWNGKTQLYYFCENGLTASVVRMLSMRSIDVEAKLRGLEAGYTCLMAAALTGRLTICRLLIDKGAQLEAKEQYGFSPLHWAARQGYIEIVRLLCDRGADVEISSYWGYVPVHMAAMHNRLSVMKELIEERNAEINARTDNGRTALRCARDEDNPAMAAYLISLGGIE